MINDLLKAKGVSMVKVTVFLCITSFGLIGCSSSSLKPDQLLDLSPYVEKVKASCIEKGEYSDLSEKDQDTLCQNRGERALDVTRSYFDLYEDERMQSKCKGESDYTACVLEYQKSHYSKSTHDFLKSK